MQLEVPTACDCAMVTVEDHSAAREMSFTITHLDTAGNKAMALLKGALVSEHIITHCHQILKQVIKFTKDFPSDCWSDVAFQISVKQNIIVLLLNYFTLSDSEWCIR